MFGKLAEWWSILTATPARTHWVQTVLVVLLVLIIARIAWVAWVHRDPARAARMTGVRTARTAGEDPLAAAERFAAAGDYTSAAHALYQAILVSLARLERVRLHPSRTIGDYVRDLRSRSSANFTRFRDFARSYEVVVYGVGRCDRDRYERLRVLAGGILQHNG